VTDSSLYNPELTRATLVLRTYSGNRQGGHAEVLVYARNFARTMRFADRSYSRTQNYTRQIGKWTRRSQSGLVGHKVDSSVANWTRHEYVVANSESN